ncbi:MAG: hypothetical protein HZB23_14935 [Deltaproteobacteria bacterium]|nr:hypothetical protein [Deltaproteobacteria bacterium]
MEPAERIPLQMVVYRYVQCPKIGRDLGRDIRLTLSYDKEFGGKDGAKTLCDCECSRECGVGRVKGGVFVNDFSGCPFEKVRFWGA